MCCTTVLATVNQNCCLLITQCQVSVLQIDSNATIQLMERHYREKNIKLSTVIMCIEAIIFSEVVCLNLQKGLSHQCVFKSVMIYSQFHNTNLNSY